MLIYIMNTDTKLSHKKYLYKTELQLILTYKLIINYIKWCTHIMCYVITLLSINFYDNNSVIKILYAQCSFLKMVTSLQCHSKLE